MLVGYEEGGDGYGVTVQSYLPSGVCERMAD